MTLEFPNMDFGKEGAGKIAIWGRTSLAKNTIHIHFTNEEGDTLNRIVEFSGNPGESRTQSAMTAREKPPYTLQEFSIEKLCGKGKVEFIFLPGSSFDFEAFRFME